MKRLHLGLLLLAGGAIPVPCAHAQSSVWKVTRDGGTIYVGGTVHVLRKEDFPLPEEFDLAYAAADELWFELDFGEMQSPAAVGLLLREGVLPGQETLQSRLSAEAWTALSDYCAQSGLSLQTMSRFKPGMLMMNIQMFEFTKLGMHQQGVEMHFFSEAQRDGKPVSGIEEIQEQLDFILALGTRDPSQLVLQTIRDVERTPALLESMLAAWRSGDLEQLASGVLKDIETDYPQVAEELVFRRNRNWIPRILPMFATGSVEFVMVGAGHLPGPKGVLALLRAEGCAIEQLVAEPAAASP